MKAFLIGWCLLCLAIMAVPALAQSPSPRAGDLRQPPAMTDLTISLWPEFDRPEMLVIYRGQFAAGLSLPLPVEFRIPAAAGKPNAVAYLDEQGDPLTLAYTTRAEGDDLIVAFELPSPGFQFEYYAPLPGSSAVGQRVFTYTYTADYPLATLSLEVQEPLGAQGFNLKPAADSITQQANGLNYHLAQAGPLDQNDTAGWTLSYEKSSAGLTADAFAATQTPAAGEPTPSSAGEPVPSTGAKKSSGLLIAAAGLIGLVGVGAGAYWLGRHSRPSPPPATPGKGQAGRPQAQRLAFCHQCGARLRTGADFCHECGTTVRKS